jgi:hypothetical protein
MKYNPSPREEHMISIGLISMAMALEKELAEITGGDPERDAITRRYLEGRIDHYRVLAKTYES